MVEFPLNRREESHIRETRLHLLQRVARANTSGSDEEFVAGAKAQAGGKFEVAMLQRSAAGRTP